MSFTADIGPERARQGVRKDHDGGGPFRVPGIGRVGRRGAPGRADQAWPEAALIEGVQRFV